jgi:hypothetical protein
MLQRVDEKIQQCFEQATRCAKGAAETSDPKARVDLMALERSWLRLAESYRLIEQLGAPAEAGTDVGGST